MNFRRRRRRGPRLLVALVLGVLLGLGGKTWWERATTTVSGTLVDAETQQPVADVMVQWEGLTTTTDSQGRFVLVGVDKLRADTPLVLGGGDYATTTLGPGEGDKVVALQPDTASGVVTDFERRPVPNARITAGNLTTVTDATGAFRLKGIAQTPQLRVVAPGYKTVTVRPGSRRELRVTLEPFTPKGMYVAFGPVMSPDVRQEWLRHLERLQLNTVVLDVTSDRGLVHASIATEVNRQAGVTVDGEDDLASLVRDLRARNLYVVARLVTFKDSPAAQQRPEWAIKVAANGAAYVDCEGQGWLDPTNRAAWDYKLAQAEKAAELGFNEIQFDYIRFPSDCIRTPLAYSRPVTDETKGDAITDFLALANERLRARGVAISADVFGLVTTEDDIGIGQQLEAMARHLDYISPMVYPSTWTHGALNIDYPPGDPYQVVYRSVKTAVDRLGKGGAIVRPWLQAFDDYGRQQLPYGNKQIADQIKAAEAAGGVGWMLWDPFGRYPLADAPQLGG